MKELTFDHLFQCTEERYWNEVFFDEAYNHAMFREALRFSVWKEVSRQESGDRIERVVEVMPPAVDVPGTVKKIIGDNFGYREIGTFDRQSRRYHVEVRTNVMADKIKISGDIWLEPAGAEQCRRKARFQLDVRIFGVGKIVENLIASDMGRQFEEGSRFTNEWLRRQAL